MYFVDALFELAAHAGTHLGRATAGLLLSPASDMSLASFLAALTIATGWLARRHLIANSPIKAKALLRLLFPWRWLRSRSAGLDVKLLALNAFVFGVVLAGAVMSHQMVSSGVKKLLAAILGTPSPAQVPEFAAAAIVTVALFLAYELAYWVYHYLSHKVPFLWSMHQVHHSAEVLTPLTNARVHPIESVLFLNTMAVFLGVTDGAVAHLLGRPVQQFTIANANLIVVVFTYLLAHLHHTHVWIPFTGVWGRILISPAHHQIHHSTNPAHFDKNMGSVLAIWDWLFGTLHVPTKARERLVFGLGHNDHTEHSVTQELLRPAHALLEGARRLGTTIPGNRTSTG